MLELRASRSRSLLFLTACLVFVSVGLFLAIDPASRWPDARLLGWTCVLFFGLGIAVALRELLRTGPRLIVSDAGIEDRTNRLGVIPWTAIAAIEVRTLHRQTFLALTMHDPEPWVERLPARLRWGAIPNRILGFSEINLLVSGLTLAPAEVAEHVQRQFHAARRAV